MFVRSIYDTTQKVIATKLVYTEFMLSTVLSKLSGNSEYVQITSMEDLGLSNNCMRMSGGFFTGMCAEWNCTIPFIPVDSTINSCGVSVFKLSSDFTYDQFIINTKKAIEKLKSNGITDNFSRGNHFISICKNTYGEAFLVVHASDNNYKYGEKGLYPRQDSWYFDKICVENFEKGYLRYIYGTTAEKFYNIYIESAKSNRIRNRFFADCFVDGVCLIESEIYSPHYGMPDRNSIAIGCQWENTEKILLSAEGQPIFIIKSMSDELTYMPHGLGLKLAGELKTLEFVDADIIINGVKFSNVQNFINLNVAETRWNEENFTEERVKEFLCGHTIEITEMLFQQYSLTRNGYNLFVAK